jgi:hypothetical protein
MNRYAHNRIHESHGELGALLLEHFVVVMGGLIVGSIAVSYLRGMHEIFALKREVYQVGGLLRRQWNSSTTTGQQGVVSISLDSAKRESVFGDSELYRLSQNTRFNTSARIHFSSHGVTTPKTVTLQQGRARCSIIISLYGRIRHRCWIH